MRLRNMIMSAPFEMVRAVRAILSCPWVRDCTADARPEKFSASIIPGSYEAYPGLLGTPSVTYWPGDDNFCQLTLRCRDHHKRSGEAKAASPDGSFGSDPCYGTETVVPSPMALIVNVPDAVAPV